MSEIELKARELLARMEKAKRNERGHWCDARAGVDAACDALPKIIRALAPHWQPISSEPKNGLPRLYLCNGISVQGFIDATGGHCMQCPTHPHWRTMKAQPSHWQPLPAPPEVSDGQ